MVVYVAKRIGASAVVIVVVSLVIFIVTAPLLTHAVRIDLPRASSVPVTEASQAIALAIDAEGTIYWNGSKTTQAALVERMQDAARLTPQPELHLAVERTAQYQVVAEILAAASKAGLTRIGFIADPRPPSAVP